MRETGRRGAGGAERASVRTGEDLLRLYRDRPPFLALEPVTAALRAVDHSARAVTIPARLPEAVAVLLASATVGEAWSDTERPPAVAIEWERLGTATGTARAHLEEAIARLLEAGVLETTADEARFAPTMFRRAGVGGHLAWRTLIDAVGRWTPTDLALVAALAERCDDREQWITLHRETLTSLLGASLSSVRDSMDRLVRAHVVERAEYAGRASAFRLAPLAFGRTWEREGAGAVAPSATTAPATSQPAGPRAAIPGREPAAPVAPPSAPAAAGPAMATPAMATPAPTVYAVPSDLQAVEQPTLLQVGGVTIPLPPGVTFTLERDNEGRFWYRAGSMRLGPVVF